MCVYFLCTFDIITQGSREPDRCNQRETIYSRWVCERIKTTLSVFFSHLMTDRKYNTKSTDNVCEMALDELYSIRI
jgi:hypothetical protein